MLTLRSSGEVAPQTVQSEATSQIHLRRLFSSSMAGPRSAGNRIRIQSGACHIREVHEVSECFGSERSHSPLSLLRSVVDEVYRIPDIATSAAMRSLRKRGMDAGEHSFSSYWKVDTHRSIGSSQRARFPCEGIRTLAGTPPSFAVCCLD